MNDSEQPITPALSEKPSLALPANLWSLLEAHRDDWRLPLSVLEGRYDEDLGATDDDAKRNAAAIAILNAALRDSDPRKITRETIARMREGAAELRSAELNPRNPQSVIDANHAAGVALDAFADALESYLPQERP
jgi:hypothetical protein